jgi:hypothetical protein
MRRDPSPVAGADVPRVTAPVWEQMAAAKRLLERLGAIPAPPPPTPPATPAASGASKDPITVAAGWGRDPPSGRGR